MKLNLQTQAAGPIWPMNHSLETPHLHKLKFITLYKYILQVYLNVSSIQKSLSYIMMEPQTKFQTKRQKIERWHINRKKWIYYTKPGESGPLNSSTKSALSRHLLPLPSGWPSVTTSLGPKFFFLVGRVPI